MKDTTSQEDLAHYCPKMVAFLISRSWGGGGGAGCAQNQLEQSTRQWRTHPPRVFRVSHAEQSKVAAKDSPKLLGGKLQAKHTLLY